MKPLKPSLLALITLTGLVPPALHAQDHPDRGFYAGASFGGTKFDLAKNAQHFFVDGASLDETDTAWKLSLGYQFNQRWGFEVSHVDLGTAKWSGMISAFPLPTPVAYAGSTQTTALTYAATFTQPVTERFSISAKLGQYQYYNKEMVTRDTGAGLLTSRWSTSGTRALAGVGLRFGLTPRVSLVLDSDHFLGSDRNITVTSGVRYRL